MPLSIARVLAPAAAAVAFVFGVAPAAPAALPAPDRPLTAAQTPPPIRHVFVINLENEGFKSTFRLNSAAPYLAHTLRDRGMLLSQYFGTAHNSLPNYIAQISGQAPNPDTQADCQTYSDFQGTGTVPPDQAVGQGCVYPASVRTLPEQLDAKGFTWAGYMEDMAHSPAPNTCRHPALNSKDDTQTAEPGDQYAVRHNPFMYFHSIIDRQGYCDSHVVPLLRLPTALRSVSTTPNLSYITPNLCHDGHDEPCVTGEPGGLVTADKWLQQWVPKILNSPAFKRDGLLVVTFDEAEAFGTGNQDASACCNESPGPNSPMPGIFGPGGGRVGAVLVSPFVHGGSFNDTAYNHYGLLCSIEDIFGLAHLGFAATTERCFGADVYNKGV